MNAVRDDIRSLIDELAQQKGLPPTAVSDLEATISSSPYLANVLSAAMESGHLKHLAVSNDPHLAGRYNSATGTIYLDASNFTTKNFESAAARHDNLTVVLGHEAGHALLSDATTREGHKLGYDATVIYRQASVDGTSADVTAVADRYLTFMRRNEAMAELVGMNALASRTTGGREGEFNREEFLRRVDPSTPCVENGALAKGIVLSPDGIQFTGKRLTSPAVEAVAQCYTDQALGLGPHGDSGYRASHGAYLMEALHKVRGEVARDSATHVPDFEMNMDALKLDPRKVEQAGIDLGGQGSTFSYIDSSRGGRAYESVSHTYSRPVAPDARKEAAQELQPEVSRPWRADNAAHPDYPAFDQIRQVVRGDGGWNKQQVDNIAAALLHEHKADPLSKRLDQVAIGSPTADGRVNVFAAYAPFGQQGPFFTSHVDMLSAAQVPAERNLAQVEQINQRQAQERVQAQLLEHTQVHTEPQMSLQR